MVLFYVRLTKRECGDVMQSDRGSAIASDIDSRIVDRVRTRIGGDETMRL